MTATGTTSPDDAKLGTSFDGEDVVLKNGSTVRLRALGPPDRQKVQAFFEGLSPRSTRYRFFGTTTVLPSREIERLTSGGASGTTGLAAIIEREGDQRVVGIAEFAAEPSRNSATAADDQEEKPIRAEFAVAVADEYQNRGIGTLLLERTALAAKQAGVDELVALVLSDNDRMLDVFQQSGFETRGERTQGECTVVFPTDQTDRFLAASMERERIAARESVRAFFEPRSVAVVGVSQNEGTIGRTIVENLVKAEFRGRVFPVGPNIKEASGLTCYRSLADIGQSVDLVVIAVPAAHVEDVVDEAAHLHAKAVVVISSGFGESSGEGRACEARITRIARNAGMRVMGPNCMGVLNASPDVRLNGTFAPVWPPSGNVSILSQNGALGIAMLEHAARLDIGLACFASVGNKADVSVNDLLSYWSEDPNTKVIALYLESFGNARKFARLAPEVARRKPIVAVKSGRSAAGTRDAASHSAALASLDVGIDALFAQAGVIRTNTLEELFDVVELLSTQPLPKGPRVGVVTNAGGPGILLADACEARGLTLPSLSTPTLDLLRTVLPAQGGFSNPVDLLAAATPEQFEKAIALVGQDPAVDSIVVIYVPPLVTNPDDIAQAIARGAGAVPFDKPVATVFISSKRASAVLRQGPRGSLPSYSFPENVALALSAAYGHAQFNSRGRGTFATIAKHDEHAIRRVIDAAMAGSSSERGTWLIESDVALILGHAGLHYVPSVIAPPNPDAAADVSPFVGFPVVLKAIATGLIHKTETSGIVMGLETHEAVCAAAVAMQARVEKAGFPLEHFIVQPQISRGFEVLVGVTTDCELGPIIVASLGGVQVELLGNAVFRLPPVSDLDARDMLDGLDAKRLFDGFRGAPPGDRQALEDIIRRISTLVDLVPEITELDLNPVMALPPGQGALVVDARILVRKQTA